MAATTADSLLSLVKLRCFWPTSAPLTNAELLLLADQEILGSLWPRLIAAQADYFLSTLDHDITADYARYRLPDLAYGPIKDVLYLAEGDEDEEGISLPMVNIEELGHMSSARSGSGSYVAYIDGDYIGLYPKPTTTQGTLRIRYYRAPSSLVLSAAATQVALFDFEFGGGIARDRFEVDSNVGSWTTGSKVDVISAGNAHQVLLDAGVVDTVLTSTVLVFTDLVDGTGLQIDDYVATHGQTPIVQLPDFMVPLLTYRVASAALMAHGDRDAAKEAAKEAERLSALADQTLSPRSEAEPLTVSMRGSALWLARGPGRAWR
jgi:hypothetical protein